MVLCSAPLLAASAVTAATPVSAGARPAAAGSAWGTARELPGMAALNQGGGAGIGSVSCAPAGNCGAGGYYTDGSGQLQAFVADQTDGTWGDAQQVPGTAALNAGGSAVTTSVSCPTAGNCGAVGTYVEPSNAEEAFVASETNGTWGDAQEIPGLAALNTVGDAGNTSVSCASAGNCAVAGTYKSHSACHVKLGCQRAFFVAETNGTWGIAQQVPGLAALNKGGKALITSVSCAAPGNCSAGGYYTGTGIPNAGSQQAFVISETHGAWGTATEVPGTAALNQGGFAEIASLSCASAGNCSAGGYYTDQFFSGQAFVVAETGGTWGTAKQVPGTAALNSGNDAGLTAISCATAGNCGAGGYYTDSSGATQVFVANEQAGVWHAAVEVPGIAALNLGGTADILSASCGSAGNCSAGGYYTGTFNPNSGSEQAFVVTEAHGSWGTAREVPGTAALNQGGFAELSSVSCASAGSCSAGGGYADSSLGSQVFVVARQAGQAGGRSARGASVAHTTLRR